MAADTLTHADTWVVPLNGVLPAVGGVQGMQSQNTFDGKLLGTRLSLSYSIACSGSLVGPSCDLFCTQSSVNSQVAACRSNSTGFFSVCQYQTMGQVSRPRFFYYFSRWITARIVPGALRTAHTARTRTATSSTPTPRYVPLFESSRLTGSGCRRHQLQDGHHRAGHPPGGVPRPLPYYPDRLLRIVSCHSPRPSSFRFSPEFSQRVARVLIKQYR